MGFYGVNVRLAQYGGQLFHGSGEARHGRARAIQRRYEIVEGGEHIKHPRDSFSGIHG